MDYLTTRTSLSPIWCGFAPGFVNYEKGCTRLATASDKVDQLLAHGRWFSPGTPASSTTKTGCHDIHVAEILLKVTLNTKKKKSITSVFKVLTIHYLCHRTHCVSRDNVCLDFHNCCYSMCVYKTMEPAHHVDLVSSFTEQILTCSPCDMAEGTTHNFYLTPD